MVIMVMMIIMKVMIEVMRIMIRPKKRNCLFPVTVRKK